MVNSIKYDNLATTDLIIDCSYEGSRSSGTSIGGEPLSKLLKCSNQGGFRYRGSTRDLKFQYIVLTSSLDELDWPDYIDVENGVFVYYGDNRSPGYELHNTRKKGNIVLKKIFDDLHIGNRANIPPIFVFTKGTEGRDIIFRGLAVPGAHGVGQTIDLVAIWKTTNKERFQNYKATFTILDVPKIKRSWINELIAGNPLSRDCPYPWKQWIDGGDYYPLRSPRSKGYRSKNEQLPSSRRDLAMVETIYSYFKPNPFKFEKCASELFRLMDANVISYNLTRPYRDGGRDAVGKYRIGLEENPILVEFSLEAKSYRIDNSVGVKEMSRLISRLRWRQFGVFVTTSYFGEQVCQEIVEDEHPVLLIASKDIIKILKNSGYDTEDKVHEWLIRNFPLTD